VSRSLLVSVERDCGDNEFWDKEDKEDNDDNDDNDDKEDKNEGFVKVAVNGFIRDSIGLFDSEVELPNELGLFIYKLVLKLVLKLTEPIFTILGE
jgi:hypothetical protein